MIFKVSKGYTVFSKLEIGKETLLKFNNFKGKVKVVDILKDKIVFETMNENTEKLVKEVIEGKYDL
jgi:hypothetical protein